MGSQNARGDFFSDIFKVGRRLSHPLWKTRAEIQRCADMNPSLTEIAHVSQGPTALFDVFGMTINTLGEGLALLREKGCVVQAIATVFSGGHENVSLNDRFEKSFRLITKQLPKGPLGHLFLGADDDSITTAAQINIAYGNSSRLQDSEHRVFSSSESSCRKIRAMREHCMRLALQNNLPLLKPVEEEGRD